MIVLVHRNWAKRSRDQLDSLATYIFPFNKDTVIGVIGLNVEETLKKKKKKERIIRYVSFASILETKCKRINDGEEEGKNSLFERDEYLLLL